MPSMTRQYSAAASQARSAVDKTARFWTQGARTLTGWLPGLPQADLIPAVERYFEFVQRTVDINRRITVKWAQAVGTLSAVARDQAEKAEKELGREARKAEREQARRAHDKARQRYEGMTKAELSDLLAERDLPKSGNVDELIERLVEAGSR